MNPNIEDRMLAILTAMSLADGLAKQPMATHVSINGIETSKLGPLSSQEGDYRVRFTAIVPAKTFEHWRDLMVTGTPALMLALMGAVLEREKALAEAIECAERSMLAWMHHADTTIDSELLPVDVPSIVALRREIADLLGEKIKAMESLPKLRNPLRMPVGHGAWFCDLCGRQYDAAGHCALCRRQLSPVVPPALAVPNVHREDD